MITPAGLSQETPQKQARFRKSRRCFFGAMRGSGPIGTLISPGVIVPPVAA
jgi:hypothetical protein